MERLNESRDKAIKKLQIADHMLTQTYPKINDPKLLLAVLENLFLALTNAMAALLHHERVNKRIEDFADTFDAKYNLFKLSVVDCYGLDRDHVSFLAEIKDLLVSHRKSPVEFSRNGALVIADDRYQLTALTAASMKENLAKTKTAVNDILACLSKTPQNIPQKAETDERWKEIGL